MYGSTHLNIKSKGYGKLLSFLKFMLVEEPVESLNAWTEDTTIKNVDITVNSGQTNK